MPRSPIRPMVGRLAGFHISGVTPFGGLRQDPDVEWRRYFQEFVRSGIVLPAVHRFDFAPSWVPLWVYQVHTLCRVKTIRIAAPAVKGKPVVLRSSIVLGFLPSPLDLSVVSRRLSRREGNVALFPL